MRESLFLYIFLTGIIAYCTILFAKNKIVMGLSVLAYLSVLEPVTRIFLYKMPYLILEYMMVIWCIIIILSIRQYKITPIPIKIFYLFTIIEFIDLIRAESFEFGRSISMMTLALLLFMIITTRVRLCDEDRRLIFSGLLIGGISLAAIILNSYFSGSEIIWRDQSNFQTSAGMGPVQISFIFAFIIFLCLMYVKEYSGSLKWFLLICSAFMFILMILTFSRGGLYILGAGIFIYHFTKTPRFRDFLVFFTYSTFIYLSFDYFQNLIGPVFLDRYSSFNSGRSALASLGWEIFYNNILLGVGTSNFYFESLSEFGYFSGTHNEIFRAGAEHGLFGLMSWLFFLITLFILIIRRTAGETRALNIALLIIFIASIFHNGLKLLLQPLIVFILLTNIEKSNKQSSPN